MNHDSSAPAPCLVDMCLPTNHIFTSISGREMMICQAIQVRLFVISENVSQITRDRGKNKFNSTEEKEEPLKTVPESVI